MFGVATTGKEGVLKILMKINSVSVLTDVQTKHCLKRDILSLHTIDLMPQHVKQAVLQKINLTRQGPGGRSGDLPKIV